MNLVSVIKTRILQLRSRYTLEKRRVESLKEQYGNSEEANSLWPLFKELDFLSEHIKGRGQREKEDRNNSR